MMQGLAHLPGRRNHVAQKPTFEITKLGTLPLRKLDICREGSSLSEQEFEPELNLPRGSRGCRDHPRGWRNLCGRRVYDGVGRGKVGVVENVEELGAELQSDLFRKRGVFQQRVSSSARSRSVERVAPGIARVPAAGARKALGLKYWAGEPG